MHPDTVSRRFLITLAAVLATPASAAAAPVLTPLKLCYVSVQTSPLTFETETMRIGGYGFTPYSIVDVTVDGEVIVSGIQIGDNGQLPVGNLPAPVIALGERPFSVTAAERDDPEQTVTLGALVSELAVRVKPRQARPTQKVTFRGRGFTGPGAIYAHYSRKGKLRRTVKLADAPSGPCGTFVARAPQFPFRPQRGTWRVQIDQQRELSDEGPLIQLSIDVRRRPKTR